MRRYPGPLAERAWDGGQGPALDGQKRRRVDSKPYRLPPPMTGTDPLQRFVSHAPTAQALLDREMRVLAYSDRWVSDHGLDPSQDHRGRSLYDVFPETTGAQKAVHQRCLAGATERGEPEPFVHADGRTRWLRAETRPWHDADDQVAGLAVHTEDLTRRVEDDRACRQRDALVAAARHVEATVWAFDADRRMTLHVGAPLDVLGVGQGWTVGEDMAEAYADLPRVVEAVERALAGASDSYVMHFGGRTFETVVSPVFDAAGAVCGGVGISLDVTDREQARSGLSEGQRLLDTALRHAPVILYAFDGDGTVTLSRGRSLGVLGLAEDEAVGDSAWSYTRPGSDAAVGMRAALDGQKGNWVEEFYGETFETTALPIGDGGAVAVSTLVTDRVRAERQAAEHTARLRRLLQATAREGTFEERARAVLGEVTEMLGLDVGLLAEVTGERYTCRTAYAARGEAMEPGDSLVLSDTYCALVDATGDVVAIEHMSESEHRDRACYAIYGLEGYIGAPVRVEGRPYGVLAFSAAEAVSGPFTEHDKDLVRLASQWAGALIERDQRERELERTAARLAEARDQAESANRTKGAFLASMSHEIRTPMNAVIGFGELLHTTSLDAVQRGYVAAIQSAGGRLLGLIDDILDFSKIEAGGIELDEAPVDLGALVQRVLAEAAPQALAKGVELAYTVDTAVPAHVVADEKRLQQIVANLVSNAVKFTASGAVDVAVRLGPAPHRASTPEGSVWVEVEVQDTGIGIGRDRLSAIFDAFVQADASMTRAYGGAGLGLAITRRFAELMGGVVEVESEPEVGSVFRVRLPLERARAAGRVVLAGATASLAGARVLVVDADADGRAALAGLLRRWDLEVADTGDPDQALGWIRDGQPFDLGLLDVPTPGAGAGGLELAEAVREHQSPAELPLVVLSSEACLRHAPGLVASTVLKPIAPVALHALLQRVLTYGPRASPAASASADEPPPA